jgi:hypothetical protein
MKGQKLTDAELVAYSGEHLLYEVQMLHFATSQLVLFQGPGAMTSAMLECFGVHLRNLIEFLYTKPGDERKDDVIATDFLPNWSEPITYTLESARKRIHKEFSHLTLGRKSGFDPTKPWSFGLLFQEISAAAKRFADLAPSTKLSPEVGKWLSMYHGLSTLPVNVGFQTTNTAV